VAEADLTETQRAALVSTAVLEICTRVLGAEHRDTLSPRDNLAAVLRGLGRTEETEA